MNYKLIMTEGKCELAFIEVLLEKGLLLFKRKELLMEKVFHKRQIDAEIIGYIQGLSFDDNVDIFRVGDKLSDNFKVPHLIMTNKIRNKYKICTLPEFEILFILNENLYDDYAKFQNLKPSEYYKNYNNNYNKQSLFVKKYFEGMSNKEIVNLINLYIKKRGKIHKKDQLTLKLLIK